MNCEEVHRCADAFHDSELDAKVTLEIRDHLAECETCRWTLERERMVDRQITESLRAGARTEAMWAKQEMVISEAFGRRAGASLKDPTSSLAGPTAAAVWWRELLWPSPKLYAGAVVCWAFMLLAQGQLGDSRVKQDPETLPPSPLAMMAVMEQREALAQLLGFDAEEDQG
jgi:anti-sigma factor RsiW